MNYEPDICFYHNPCDDGFGAAYFIWTKWPDIKFISISHGDVIDKSIVRDKHVLMVDFSVKRDVMEDLAEYASSIVILDHHISAEQELNGFIEFDGSQADLQTKIDSHITEYVFVHFNMGHSGAVLAWNFARPTGVMPFAIKLIEDRDLWTWAYSETKPFHLALAGLPRDFNYWCSHVMPRNCTEELVAKGEAIEAYQDKLIEQIAGNARLDFFALNDYEGYRNVVFCNTPVLQSEVGNYLIKKYSEAPFAAIWYDNDKGERRYSLRSEAGRVDVSAVAREFGGGGHKAAAGFTTLKDVRLK